jgi:hypothetical protein
VAIYKYKMKQIAERQSSGLRPRPYSRAGGGELRTT